MSTTQGNDDECSGIKVAAHLGRSLDLQFDPQEQIPYALYLYNREKQSGNWFLLRDNAQLNTA
jgi:hypothetical protein